MRINEIDKLYEQDLIEVDGQYKCPVCEKFYKRKISAEKHFAKKDCFNVADIFADTPTEVDMLTLARFVFLNLKGIQPFNSVIKFRKSKMYALLGRLFIYAELNNINDVSSYIAWGIEATKSKEPHRIISFLLKERTKFSEYFLWKNNHLSDEEQYKFFMLNRDKCENDSVYLLRQVEKGNLSFEWLIRNNYLSNNVLDNMTEVQKQKIQDMIVFGYV